MSRPRGFLFLRPLMLLGLLSCLSVPVAAQSPTSPAATWAGDADTRAITAVVQRYIFVGRVWEPRVSIAGGIAVFIAPYDAWRDGVFGACGIDHYILARSGGRWLVSQLIFTRQRVGCPKSPLGDPR